MLFLHLLVSIIYKPIKFYSNKIKIFIISLKYDKVLSNVSTHLLTYFVELSRDESITTSLKRCIDFNEDSENLHVMKKSKISE